MTDLHSRLYFNNRCIKWNVRFGICIAGHIDEGKSNEEFPNLKNDLIPFFFFLKSQV